MAEPVYVIGAGRTDFKRNIRKEGKSLSDLVVEAGRTAITSASIDPRDIQSGVVGNFAAGLFTRQLHVGALLLDIDPALRGMPTVHVEAACASGARAVVHGAEQIMGGLRDVVLVVGAEQQKTMSPAEGGDVLGAAGDYQREKAQFGQFMFPKLFAHIAELYAQRYGLTNRALSSVAVKNYAHASRNPLAQMRSLPLSVEQACEVSQANPLIAPPLKITDCSQITDGAAGLILCSQAFLRKLDRRPSTAIRLAGIGQTTDYLAVDRKDVPEFSVARKAAVDAYAMAGIGPRDLGGADVHDCFSISEILAYEVLGFADRGRGGELVESGVTAMPWARDALGVGRPPWELPVNPGGGLIGDGHPVGATGVRQVVEAFWQLTGAAGERQIPGVRKYLTFNMGGTLTTNVTMIWSQLEQCQPMPNSSPIRLLTAVPLCDGHDSAINTINLELVKAGMEVVYLGFHRSVADIVRAAIQEDVRAIGLSSYNGGHVEFFSDIVKHLRQRGAGDIGVFGGGGGTITPADARQMRRRGVGPIFFAGTPLDEMMEAIRQTYKKPSGATDRQAADVDRILARQLTRIESARGSSSRGRETARRQKRRARVIGITGPGGAGKTTLIDELTLRALSRSPEARIAILSHDPSILGAGALLGDRASMIYCQDDRVFMRSLASRGRPGGLSPATERCLRTLTEPRWEFDLIFVETVGVGQEAMPFTPELVDRTVLVMSPDYGARLQLQKIVMLDRADVVVVNKSDRAGATTASTEIRQRIAANGRDQQLAVTCAKRHRDSGVDALADLLEIAPAQAAGATP